jgi:phosphoglycolate phosphatase
VFDLDGTLIDSRRDLAESANEMLDGLGGPRLPIDLVADMIGDGARVLVQRACAAAGISPDLDAALGRFLSIYDRRLFDHTLPYAGTVELLTALSAGGVRLALLTNKPQPPAGRLIEGFGFAAHLSGLVGGDAGFPRKPDPAGLLALAAGAGCAPRETLMVGDSRIDLETARRAGTTFGFAAYGFGARHVDPASLGPDDLRLAAPLALLPFVLG